MDSVKEPKYLATILIAAYNYGQYIRATLQSISEYIEDDKFQVIIINDCSTDDTDEIIGEFKKKILYLRNERNLGKSLCTKMGIELAEGKYFFVLDADDLYSAGKVTKALEIFEKYPNVMLVNHDYLEIDSEGQYLGEYIYPLNEGIYKGNEYVLNFIKGNSGVPVGFGSIFCTRTNMLKLISEIIDDEFKQSIDSFLQIAAISSGDFYHLPEKLFSYRIHGDSLYQSRPPLDRIKLLKKALVNISKLQYIKSDRVLNQLLLRRIEILNCIINSEGFYTFLKKYLTFLVKRRSLTLKPVLQFIFRKVGRI